MKKLINNPEEVVREELEGIALAHADLVKVHYNPDFITRADGPIQGKVAVISGGGSGHEPMHGGFVGMGMLDDLPFVNEEKVFVDTPVKILAYTDGLVELIDEDDVEWGTRFIEEKISNPESLESNIADIIRDQKIEEGNSAIFDDITILGIEFSGWL